MITLLILGGSATLALLGLLTAVGFGVAWVRSRRSLQALALRMDTESQVEQATAQTLAAMREAARVYVQGRSRRGVQ